MIHSYDRFNFGKYRNWSAIEVARVEPGYIYFCENELGVRFTNKVKRECLVTSARRKTRGPLFY